MSWNRLHIHTNPEGSLLQFSGRTTPASQHIAELLTDQEHEILEAQSPDGTLLTVRPPVEPETFQHIAKICFANDPPVTVFDITDNQTEA